MPTLFPYTTLFRSPTNGLDPSARQRMVRMIRDIRDSRQLQIVLCSHLLRDVEDTCEEVLILNHGQVAHYSNLEEERKANKRFLELETYGVNGVNGDFTAAIEKLGCECAVTANRLKMILADGVEIRDIYRIAAEREVRIRRLNFRRDTLEDIFLKAMGS
jgi:ABC-2 type transport system ATP-binding protein